MIATAGMDPVTVTYNDVKDLIDSTVAAFVQRYGGDYDDLRANANSYFIRAYHHPKDHYSTFEKKVAAFVWYNLIEELRTKYGRRGNRKTATSQDLTTVQAHRGFDLSQFLLDASPDLAHVTMLVVDPPAGLATKIAARGGETRNYRPLIREHLQAEGWSDVRIKAALDEGKELLA